MHPVEFTGSMALAFRFRPRPRDIATKFITHVTNVVGQRLIGNGGPGRYTRVTSIMILRMIHVIGLDFRTDRVITITNRQMRSYLYVDVDVDLVWLCNFVCKLMASFVATATVTLCNA